MTPTRFDGFLVVDKPLHLTSRDAVNRAQRWFPRGTRLGHTGTLDPLATGVLVLCVGVATRLTEYVQHMSKTYTTTIRLGATSATDDAEGPISEQVVEQIPDRQTIETACVSLLGEIQQTPPAFSAAKVRGARAYDLARKGAEVSLEARTVRVDAIRLLRYEWPWLELEIDCGKGTYVRSLARDLGEALGCGGMVQTLRRTRVGEFRAEGALSVEAAPMQARSRLLPLLSAAPDLPRIVIRTEDVARLRDGRGISMHDAPSGECALVDDGGALLAIGRWDAVRRAVVAAKMLSS